MIVARKGVARKAWCTRRGAQGAMSRAWRATRGVCKDVAGHLRRGRQIANSRCVGGTLCLSSWRVLCGEESADLLANLLQHAFGSFRPPLLRLLALAVAWECQSREVSKRLETLRLPARCTSRRCMLRERRLRNRHPVEQILGCLTTPLRFLILYYKPLKLLLQSNPLVTRRIDEPTGARLARSTARGALPDSLARRSGVTVCTSSVSTLLHAVRFCATPVATSTTCIAISAALGATLCIALRFARLIIRLHSLLAVSGWLWPGLLHLEVVVVDGDALQHALQHAPHAKSHILRSSCAARRLRSTRLAVHLHGHARSSSVAACSVSTTPLVRIAIQAAVVTSATCTAIRAALRTQLRATR